MTGKKKLDLSDKKIKLLEKLLRQQGVETTSPEKIVKRKRDGAPPVSFAQQRMWFLQQFEKGASAYNIFGAVHIRGPVGIDTMRNCIYSLNRFNTSVFKMIKMWCIFHIWDTMINFGAFPPFV